MSTIYIDITFQKQYRRGCSSDNAGNSLRNLVPSTRRKDMEILVQGFHLGLVSLQLSLSYPHTFLGSKY